MAKVLSLILAVSLAVSSSGCASFLSGKKEDVTIQSNPKGAKVTIDGIERGVTPLTVELKRKNRHEIVLEKEGYDTETRVTKRGMNWWLLIDAIWGIFAIFPVIYDMGTGAAYSVNPDEFNITLMQKGASGVTIPPDSQLTSRQKEKIRKLDDLKKEGRITSEDYNRLAKEALDEDYEKPLL